MQKLLRPTIVALFLALMTTNFVNAAPPEIKIWPDGVQNDPLKMSAEKIAELEKKNTAERIYYVADPTIQVYKAPKDTANGCAVVICPGGGYHILAFDHEGHQLAEWFNSLGVTAVLLKYRVPRRSQTEPHKIPMQDAQRAMRLTRQHARDWNIDPQRVGLMGFSAGGSLTVMTSLYPDEQTYKPVDEADKLSAKPNFMMPIYAAYLGDKDDRTRLSPLMKITKDTPPTFLAVTQDDQMRGLHAALFLVEMTKAKVPCEVHVYSKGGHGYGIRPSNNPVSTWHHRCEEWMRVSGFLKATSAQ